MVLSDIQIIQTLKEKLHQSFLQISDIEKIYEGELQAQKETYQSKIQLLEIENQRLRNKIDQLQKASKKDYLLFLEGLDEVGFKNDFQKFSTSFFHEHSIAQLLYQGSFNSKKEDMHALQTKILEQITKRSYEVINQYFQISHDLYQENCHLKEDLQIVNSMMQGQIKKNQEILKLNQELLKSSNKLKEDNKKLAQMYKEQLQKSNRLQKILVSNKNLTIIKENENVKKTKIGPIKSISTHQNSDQKQKVKDLTNQQQSPIRIKKPIKPILRRHTSFKQMY